MDAAERGVRLMHEGDLGGAETALREAVASGDVGAACDLGVVLEKRNKPEKAEKAYRQAMAAGVPEAAFNLAVLLKDKGDVEGAEEALVKAVELGYPLAAMNLGFLRRETGDLPGAEAAYRAGVDLGADAVFPLTKVLVEQGKLEEAKVAVRPIAEARRVDGWHLIGALLQEMGDRKGAEKAFRRAEGPEED